MSVTVTQNTQTVEIVDQQQAVTVAPVTQSVTISTVGTQGIQGEPSPRYYGAFQDSTTQTIASTTTAYTMTFNTTDISNGVALGTPTSRMVVTNAGVYNMQWSGQFENTDNQDQDVTVWIRVNGVDVVGSAGKVAVPARHGAINGHCIAAWNYLVSLTANQYVELVWSATNTAVALEAYAASGSPTKPSVASVIATMVLA